jgi:hypothetical protein
MGAWKFTPLELKRSSSRFARNSGAGRAEPWFPEWLKRMRHSMTSSRTDFRSSTAHGERSMVNEKW